MPPSRAQFSLLLKRSVSFRQDGNTTTGFTTTGLTTTGLTTSTPITTTTYSPSRLGAYGVSQWLNTDIDRVYTQTLPKDTTFNGRLSLVNTISNETIDLKSQIAALQKENELLRLRTTEEVRYVNVPVVDNQTTVLLAEKTKECDTWRSKFSAADAEAHRVNVQVQVLTKENQHLVQLVSSTKDEQGKYELLRVQFAQLQAEYNSLNQLRNQFTLGNQEKERQLTAIIAERERTISELSVRLGNSQTMIAESEATRQKIAFYASENQRLTTVVAEHLKTIDQLRFRLNQLSNVEASLAATTEEKARLMTTLTQKLAEIETLKSRSVEYNNFELRLRGFQSEREQLLASLAEKVKIIDSLTVQINSLQVQLSRGSDYQSKINLLLAENERLNTLVLEKARIIEDWASRYTSLEQLYLHIKETTEQLDYVKRKFDAAVVHTEKLDSRLKQSADLRNSRVITEASTSPSKTYYNTTTYKVVGK